MHRLFYMVMLSLLAFLSCNTTEPPPEKGSISLSAEDVSCTEVWLRIKTDNVSLPCSGILTIGKVTENIKIFTADTLLYIDSLLPAQIYAFEFISGNSKSNKSSVQTLDTTSQNFSWQTWTFGNQDGGAFYDLAIMNDNCVWAVGEIYINDSLGLPDLTRYNLAVWNGSDWSLKRVPYNFQGGIFYNPIITIFAFSPQDIWLAGNGILHWDGNNFIGVPIPTSIWGPYQINKIWGTSDNDLYIVGNEGHIAHYDGKNWEKIESGTDLRINDIWGMFNNKNNKYEVLCIASDLNQNNGNKILRLIGTNVQEINNQGISWNVASLWFVPRMKYYIAGDGLYSTSSIGNNWTVNNSIPPYTETSIRGNDVNDIMATGAYGFVVHYNGIRWKSFMDQTYIAGAYTRVEMKGENIYFVGGLNNQQAIICKARRL